MRGLVFDIEEFAVFDGPGIRCAVFLKGCPLACRWCHNPEGLAMKPERLKSGELCLHCGACDKVCPSPGACTACGKCVKVCPRRCLSIAGEWMEPEQAAERIQRNADLLIMNGGGVTFTGGEVLLQPEFVMETRRLLPKLHAAIETSGYARAEIFQQVAGCMDLVMMDIKHTDPEIHKRFTGVSNEQIRQNLYWLKGSGIPFIARIPLIPGVNDTEINLETTAAWLEGAENLIRVEMLPYNRAAGAKYSRAGREFDPGFDESAQPRIRTEPFRKRGMEVFIQ